MFRFKLHTDRSSGGIRCQCYAEPPLLRVLSFKGGAARAFVYRAVLEYLHNAGILRQIEEIGGSSAGSIAAVFACIPYDGSSKRTEAMDAISDSNLFDIMGNSYGWSVYKAITYPLHLMERTISWLANSLGKAASTFNDSSVGKVIAYPLQTLSIAVNTAVSVISPKLYAALFNLIVARGIYQGRLFQQKIMEQIQNDVQTALDALLENMPDRELYTQKLIDIKLCTLIDGKLIVLPDITFNHFFELSKLPNSQFKQCYLTALRREDKKLVVLNKENFGDMPFHLAIRIACAFPFSWQYVSYQGYTYMDGGIYNNAPVDLASSRKRSPIEEAHGITDRLSRLNIRVEYPHEYPYHLWRKPPVLDRWERFQSYLFESIFYLCFGGIDAFAADKDVTRNMQTYYPQRTLQLPDFEFPHFDMQRIQESRDQICNDLMPIIQEYFVNHDGELIIESYDLPQFNPRNSQMPQDLQTALLDYLRDTSNRTSEIFEIPDKSARELEEMRILIINNLSASNSTTKIANTLGGITMNSAIDEVLQPESSSGISQGAIYPLEQPEMQMRCRVM